MAITGDDEKYAHIVEAFAAMGKEIIEAVPRDRYGPSVGDRTRPLEPGFIPPNERARIVIVSYYPNASTLNVSNYGAIMARFMQWGRTGSVDAYRAAHADWQQTMPLWPFYRKWMRDVIAAVDVVPAELAWLPLVKLPCPPEAPPTDDIVKIDRPLLRRQLELLSPDIIWVQALEIYEYAGGLIEDIQPRHVLQKLYKTKTSSSSPETPAIIKSLKRFLSTAPASRKPMNDDDRQ